MFIVLTRTGGIKVLMLDLKLNNPEQGLMLS